MEIKIIANKKELKKTDKIMEIFNGVIPELVNIGFSGNIKIMKEDSVKLIFDEREKEIFKTLGSHKAEKTKRLDELRLLKKRILEGSN